MICPWGHFACGQSGKLTAIVCKSLFASDKLHSHSHSQSQASARCEVNQNQDGDKIIGGIYLFFFFFSNYCMYVWSCVQVSEYLQRGAAEAGKVEDRPKVVSGAHGEMESNRIE